MKRKSRYFKGTWKKWSRFYKPSIVELSKKQTGDDKRPPNAFEYSDITWKGAQSLQHNAQCASMQVKT